MHGTTMPVIQATICLQSTSQHIVVFEGRSIRLECLYSGSLHTLLWIIDNINYPIFENLPENHQFDERQHNVLIVDEVSSAMNDSVYQCAADGMISGAIHLYVIPGIYGL